jgi:hypothetical protein
MTDPNWPNPNTSDNWADVQSILQLFFPQFFDSQSSQYVDPVIMAQLVTISEDARPWCLPESQQDIAQAYFIAYLVSLRKETSSGVMVPQVAGPIVSEREGDIQVAYANLNQKGSQSTQSRRPPSDPWDVWNRYWMRCAAGAITTRFGDPCRNGSAFTLTVLPAAWNVWYPIW